MYGIVTSNNCLPNGSRVGLKSLKDWNAFWMSLFAISLWVY